MLNKNLYKGTKAPPKSNQRFYPFKNDHTQPYLQGSRQRKIFKIRSRKIFKRKSSAGNRKCPDEMFFFRPLVKYSDESSPVKESSDDNDDDYDDDDDDNTVLPNSKNGLLFVHQTENQKCLLQRYGNELTLLDATYKHDTNTGSLCFSLW